jgi:WD40 repeat protein
MVECIEDAHSLNITAITTHEYSQRLYSGSRDYTVKGWDTVTMQSTNSFFAPRNVVTCLTMNNEGSSIYQGSEDLAIRIWDIRANSSKPTDTIQSFVYFPLSLSMHPTNNFLLAVGCKGIDGVGGEIKLFDLRKITMPLEEFLGHRHDITGCTMSSSSNHIISVSKDCTIRGWNYCDTTNGTNNNDCFVVPMVSDTIDKQFTCITEMRSTESAYAGAFDGSICKIDLQKSKESNKRTIEYEEIVEAYNKKDAL